MITPDDRLPVAFPRIEGFARRQADTVVEKCDPVTDRQVPPQLCEAAKHALGHFASVAPPTHLALGKPGSGWRHWDEVTLVQERQAAPHDLRLVASRDFDVGQPDPVTIRMGTDLNDPPHDHASRPHESGTVPLIVSGRMRWAAKAVKSRFGSLADV